MPYAFERYTPPRRQARWFAGVLAMLAVAMPALPHAEERRYFFDGHDSAARLAQHSVNAIFQDHAGYMWIATQGGLNAWNGYQYRLYHHDADNPASLPDDFVTAIAEDRNNRIWVGSNNGNIASLDPESGRATAYPLPPDAPDRERRNDVTALAVDRNQSIWIGTTAGIELFDPRSGKRRIVYSFPASQAEKRVSDLIFASDGTLWAATGSGVLHLDANGEGVKPIAAEAISAASALMLAKGGVLYAGTPAGLYRLDPGRGSSERIWPKAGAGLAPGNQDVRRLAQDAQGRLWLSIERAGLVVYDPATGLSEALPHDFDLPGSPPENSVTALFVDRSGTLWVGGATRGFATVDPRGARFVYIADLSDEPTINAGNNVRAIFEDHNYLWLGTQGAGLKRYDRSSGKFESFNAPLVRALPDGSGPAQVVDVRGSSDGLLWLATDRGVFEFDPARRRARLLPVDAEHGRALPSPTVKVMLPARDGSIWFGTADAGLAHWWPSSSRWEFFRHGNSSTTGLAHDTVLALIEDRDERIWIGTPAGLSVYDPRQQAITTFHPVANDVHSLSDDTVLALHQHSDGTLWVGTRSGLNRLDVDATLHGRFTHYSIREGAAGNAIFAIEEDRKGVLWISSNRGISSFDHEHELFHNFSLKDGLQGLEFNAGAAAALADGKLAFGGSEGVNLFDPSDIRFSRYAAPVVVTGLFVDGKQLPLPPSDGDLHMSAGERIVRFEFAALDYAAPDHNVFAYRLHGFDDNWIMAGTRHDATYTNLPAGDYCLEVRGANHDGTWNERTATVGLVVDPPWWATRLMLALYGALALLLLERLRYLYTHRRRAEVAHNTAIAERENRLRLALWGSGDEFWDWDLRRNELRMTGTSELMGSGAHQKPQPADAWIRENVHEDDRAVVAERLDDHLAGLRDQFESEHRVRNPEGKWTWVFVRGKIVERNEQGRPLRMSGTVRDVTVSRAAERERRIAAEVIDSMTEAVCVTDLEFRFVSANRAFTRMTGYEQAAIIGQPASILNCGKHPPEHYRTIREIFMRDGHWRGELWQRRKDGEEFLCWLEISVVHDAVGERTHYVGVMGDITDRKRAEQELRYLANYDTMTGLPNRALLSERLGQAIVRARHSGRRVAVLFLDLDRFKHVNDSMGHAAGDRMLRAAGARLRACIASTDTVARLGGDEFTVVLENLQQADQAEDTAQKLLEAFVVPLHLDSGEDVVISPSIGISLFPDHGHEASELLKSADTAMYQAKEHGRNTYMFYTAEMDADARSRATLIAALRRGLERNEFYVVYQPKLSLVEDRITGLEALLRWNSEELGPVSPGTFIPLAEDTGLIVPIGEYVLNAACAQLRRWHDQGFTRLKVAVNLSMLQLLRADLAVRLRQILDTHGLNPDCLELELTETAVMANAAQSVRTLSELKSIGVTLSIDDFGTGYSSLSYLKRLPIDTLKIDQAFVGDITTDPEDAAITSTIITMAHSLGLEVVAEGVETAEQLQYLRSQGCDEIQGHWFARPLDADACFAFLSRFENSRVKKATA
jgi:diguanylate cyclase (GGDEF)-like protein/PAS domain S-box-containing protein